MVQFKFISASRIDCTLLSISLPRVASVPSLAHLSVLQSPLSWSVPAHQTRSRLYSFVICSGTVDCSVVVPFPVATSLWPVVPGVPSLDSYPLSITPSCAHYRFVFIAVLLLIIIPNTPISGNSNTRIWFLFKLLESLCMCVFTCVIRGHTQYFTVLTNLFGPCSASARYFWVVRPLQKGMHRGM